MPTIESLPTLPRRLRSNSVKPTTPTFLSLPDIPPPTKPVVYSPVPTMHTLRGAILTESSGSFNGLRELRFAVSAGSGRKWFERERVVKMETTYEFRYDRRSSIRRFLRQVRQSTKRRQTALASERKYSGRDAVLARWSLFLPIGGKTQIPPLRASMVAVVWSSPEQTPTTDAMACRYKVEGGSLNCSISRRM